MQTYLEGECSQPERADQQVHREDSIYPQRDVVCHAFTLRSVPQRQNELERQKREVERFETKVNPMSLIMENQQLNFV